MADLRRAEIVPSLVVGEAVGADSDTRRRRVAGAGHCCAGRDAEPADPIAKFPAP